jgi:hypothetical protein
MPRYKVAVFAALFVEARDHSEALDIAHDSVIGCDIKAQDFEFDVELWDDDVNTNHKTEKEIT